MARLGNIAIGFDYTKIDYKGAFDLNPPAEMQGNRNTNTANVNSSIKPTR